MGGGKTALRSLDLSRNNIKVDGVRFIVAALSSPDVCTLKHLDLGMNRIGSQ